jgi:hypothetical protein
MKKLSPTLSNKRPIYTMYRAVASIYTWGGGGGGGGGGVGQKFPNDKKNSEYFMAYETTKVFVSGKRRRNLQTNIHIFYAETYCRSMQCCRKLFLIGG